MKKIGVAFLIIGAVIGIFSIVYIMIKGQTGSIHSVTIKFTEYEESMKKDIEITDAGKQLDLKYTSFELERGAFVFQLMDNNTVIEEQRLTEKNRSKGTIEFSKLESGKKYQLIVFAEDAYRGGIHFTW